MVEFIPLQTVAPPEMVPPTDGPTIVRVPEALTALHAPPVEVIV